MKRTPALYPNRKLGFASARSDDACTFHLEAWVNIALANLVAGESIMFRGRQVEIVSVSERRLRYQDQGKVIAMSPFSSKWETFVRDLAGELMAFVHSERRLFPRERNTLWEALCRDPAFACVDGAWGLRDPLSI